MQILQVGANAAGSTIAHLPFIKIAFISLWAGLMGVDSENFMTHLHRPVVSGLVIGLILHNVHTGLITGASIELAFLGLIPIAGSQPPNPTISGILGSSFAILMNVDPKVVVGLVIPFAVLLSVGMTLLYTSFAFLANRADNAAEAYNYPKMCRQPLWGLLYLFALFALSTGAVLTFGEEPATRAINSLPPFIIGGLTLAGGAMPAVGFALLLTIMLRKEYVAYLALGFVLASYLHLPATAIAILALSLAAIDFVIRQKFARSVKSTLKPNSEEEAI